MGGKAAAAPFAVVAIAVSDVWNMSVYVQMGTGMQLRVSRIEDGEQGPERLGREDGECKKVRAGARN
jgi:hypothetical protein